MGAASDRVLAEILMMLPPISQQHTRLLLRLTPDEDAGWTWYKPWEERVLMTAKEHSTWIPTENLRAHVRNLWATIPKSLGAWMLFEDMRPIAHACAWLQTDFGTLTILVFQVVADQGYQVTEQTNEFLESLHAWREEINDCYAKAGSPLRVSRVLFATQRGEAFNRYLKGRLPVRRALELLECE